MNRFGACCCVAVGIVGVLAPRQAEATFHFMQIEQVIGGVGGDTSAQAIQLRMRSAGQNLVGQARMFAHDASGSNPVLLIDFPSNVTSSSAGSRVLVTSTSFNSATDPSAVNDFTFTDVIPESYLAAGSLTFEDNFGTIYWRLSWGGSAYTGPTTGSFTNDGSGDFGPPFPGALPSTSAVALLFQGAASATSSQNINDYAQTVDAAVFTNNAGASFAVVAAPESVPTMSQWGVMVMAAMILWIGSVTIRKRRAPSVAE